MSIKIEVNESVSEFLSRVKELRDKLADVNEQVSSNDLVTITLNGMVSYYHVFKTSLATRENTPYLENLVGILLQEEERKKHVGNRSQSVDSTLMVKDKKPYTKQWSKNKGWGKFDNQRNKEEKRYHDGTTSKSNVKKIRNCHYCHKLGHYAYECYKKKNNESKNNKYEGNFVNSDDTISDCNDWFIDSRASIHMSCHRNWFKNFQEHNDGRKIYLGDNRSHDVKGCGDISVQSPNGHVKELSNVMYVPRIKK